MARAVSVTTKQLLADGGLDRRWVADLMYDGQRRFADVAIRDVDLSWDGGQFVAGSGSCTVVWADDHGSSMIPMRIGDLFAPFGAELQIDCVVSAGKFAERIPMGRFMIDEIPGTVQADMPWRDRVIHPGESFDVVLKDGMQRVISDRFPFPTASKSTSVWGEIQNITGMPIVRNVPDVAITSPVTHDEEKSAAVSKLFDRLGAWPMLNAAGVLMARPKAWPLPVDEVVDRVSAPRALASAKTYNRVVVEGKDPAGNPLYGVADVREGFLRVANADGTRSPFGVRTYGYASEFLTTQEQVDAYAAELLPRVSRVRGVQREISERFNPLREVGDVLRFDGGLVRVRSVRHTDATTECVVEVPDD